MQPPPPPVPPLAGRRADAGTVKLTDRDITGLMLSADHYAAPYDLLAAALNVRGDRLRGIVARWRHTGYAETGTLATGPRLVLADHGRDEGHRPELPRDPSRPGPDRAHPRGAGRAVVAPGQRGLHQRAGMVAQRTPHPRRYRRARRRRAYPGRRGALAQPGRFPVRGQVWAIEAELTPKPLARTVAIMRGLLARTSDYGPGAATAHGPRYGQVVYLTAPAARPVVTRAVDALPAPLQPRIVVRDLPAGAAL